MAEITDKELAELIGGMKSVVEDIKEIKQDMKDHANEHKTLAREQTSSVVDVKKLNYDMYNKEGVLKQEITAREGLEKTLNRIMVGMIVVSVGGAFSMVAAVISILK